MSVPARDFEREDLRMAVIGLGYVGLPLALAFVEAGLDVTGIDTSLATVAELERGRSPVDTIGDDAIVKALATTRFRLADPTRDASAADAVLICVPTPLGPEDRPDTRFIQSAIQQTRASLRPGQLVVVCSTTYPGLTHDLCRPALQRSGLQAGIDFFLAHSPERLDPAGKHDPARVPRIVGGETETCTRLACALFGRITRSVVPVSSTQTAEMAKLLENTFRLVNVALVNELAQLCPSLGVDVWEVVAAAATKPYGFMPFEPGPGAGGHCIPVDPHYLQWRLSTLGRDARFIRLATEVNRAMPDWIVERVAAQLGRDGLRLDAAFILVLGLAYKADIADLRESPALEVMSRLASRGTRLAYHDPLIPAVTVEGHPYRSVRLTDEVLASVDLALILTDHSQVSYAQVCAHAARVFDARNATAAVGELPHVERL